MRKLLLAAVLVIGTLAAIQLVPYGRNHSNPPVAQEPRWRGPETRALAVRACFDCHSNETVWPWYASVAPVSWLVQRDVDEGRGKVNFSEWNRRQGEARELAKTVREGEMPPWYYALPGTSARLTAAERAALIAGLEATAGPDGRQGSRTRERDED